MFRNVILIISFLLLQSVSWGADKAPVFTQKDFARLILKQLSLSEGLPKETADRDYLLILSGKRTFRYEAENAYNELTDRVTMREFPLFGEFTGKGWLFGTSDSTSVTFTILLPVAGEYTVKAVIKGKGFVWSVDDKEYRTDSDVKKFQETDVAKVKLKAGVATIKVVMPRDGAIDSFTLAAPDEAPIQPLMGWRFKDGLTAVRMAEIAVSMTNSYAQLPDAEQSSSLKPIAVFEKIALPSNVLPTDDDYLGKFSSAKWVRADFRGATLQIPVAVADAGYYSLTANIMGGNISGKINNISFKLAAKSYLSKINLGVYRLESGENTLSINLPPMGGIDSIELSKKSTSPDDFMRLAGVRGPAERLVGGDEAAALLKSIQGPLAIRK